MRRLWDRICLWWARRRRRKPHDNGGDRYFRSPPSEAEFLAELLEAERKAEPPSKYRREP